MLCALCYSTEYIDFCVLLTVLPSRYNSCKWPTWRTILFSICLFQFSTCFEQPRAHHQENQLYQYNIWYVSLCVGKAGDTLSSRHMSSRDVTSAVGIFYTEFWRTLTLLSLYLRHVIWRGAVVSSHASTPLKFLLLHTFRETWRTSRQITWRKQSDRSVSVRQNSMLNIPTALVTSRELTW
jgi:hypothetical protein